MESESDPDPERDVSFSPPAPNPSHPQPLLRPAKSRAFKREERHKRKERKRQERLVLELAQWEPLDAPPRAAAAASPSGVPPPNDTPWVCDAPPPANPAPFAVWSWGPPAEPTPEPLKPPAPAAAARCPQAVAASACRSFFEQHFDEADEEEGEEMDRFFGHLIESDADLSGLYDAERERGRFLCLVCSGAAGARAGKSFVGCRALVHHAESITRTRWRLAHRAFAGAVSRLLGWGAGRTTPSPSLMQVDSDDDGVW